jgi:hypothetical protein
VREAIQQYVARSRAELTPYEVLKDVIGIVKDGPTGLSVDTGGKVRQMLLRRAKAKR